MDLTLYKLTSKGKPYQWRIKVTDNLIETWDGHVDGKLKYTPDTVSEGKNIGKSNETTPEEQALLMAQRKVEMKLRKGYGYKIPDDGEPTINDDFFNNPPRNFVGPKPKSKLESADEKKAGNLTMTRKYNGMCTHIVIGKNGPRIFTSNMDDKTDCFPWQLEEFAELPPNTWLMAEAILDDDPDKMKTVFGRSTGEKAQEEQEKMGRVQFMIFNVLYFDGEPMDGRPYHERITFASAVYCDNRIETDYVHFLEYWDYDIDLAHKTLKQNPDWEGFVIWDMESTRVPIKWGGAPSRNGGAWKLKNFKEADVLIIDWETGRGKLNNEVATLSYGVYDDYGNIIPLGRGGSGLDANLRKEIKQATLPIVAEVKYEEITKAGKFRLPVIMRTRTDKLPVECTLDSIEGACTA